MLLPGYFASTHQAHEGAAADLIALGQVLADVLKINEL